MDNDDQ